MAQYRIMLKGQNDQFVFHREIAMTERGEVREIWETSDVQALADKFGELLKYYPKNKILPITVIDLDAEIVGANTPNYIENGSWKITVNDGRELKIEYSAQLLGEKLVCIATDESLSAPIISFLTAKFYTDVKVENGKITAKTEYGKPIENQFLEIPQGLFRFYDVNSNSGNFFNSSAIIELVPEYGDSEKEIEDIFDALKGFQELLEKVAKRVHKIEHKIKDINCGCECGNSSTSCSCES